MSCTYKGVGGHEVWWGGRGEQWAQVPTRATMASYELDK